MPTKPSDPRSRKFVKVDGVDPEFGLVFGRAIICTENGEEYFDSDNQHIPVPVMMKAVVDWASSAQLTGEMHAAESGAAVFHMPWSNEIAKAFGMETPWEGFMVAYRPTPEVLEKFKSGAYTGFSVGGSILDWEDLD